MSGGYFDLNQFRCISMAESIESLIIKNATADKHEKYSEETINKFEEAVKCLKQTIKCLKQAGEMAQRIDWLVSGDEEIRVLADSDTMPTLLPGSALFLGLP